MHHNQWYDEESDEAQAYHKVFLNIACWSFVVDGSIFQVMQADGHHKAQLSHELIAAAASYEVCNLLDSSLLTGSLSTF